MDLMKRLLLGGAVLMLAVVVAGGCSRDKDKKPGGGPRPAPNGSNHKEEDYVLFHTDDESHHVRLKIDKGAKKAQATVHDKDNKEIKPVEAESLTLNLKDSKEQIVLKAEPAAGDPKGKSSVFVAEHERFAQAIDPEKAEINGKIAGKNYIFTLDEEHHKK